MRRAMTILVTVSIIDMPTGFTAGTGNHIPSVLGPGVASQAKAVSAPPQTKPVTCHGLLILQAALQARGFFQV